MPKNVFDADFKFLPHAELLAFEEIARVARTIFVEQGVQKIRLTGGEPLMRRNLERLVEMLAKLGEIDLTLTTNGALLAKKARSLVDAGLTRVTVSLDSLDDATFRAMNDVDFPSGRSSRGIDAAAAAGLAPIKINMVVKRGTNDSSIVAMARRFKGTGHIVRFIEYMDVGATNGWRMDDVVPAAEVVRAIHAELPLVNADPSYAGQVSSAGVTSTAAARSASSRRRRCRFAATARARAFPPTASSTRARSPPMVSTCAHTRRRRRSQIADAIAGVGRYATIAIRKSAARARCGCRKSR